MSVVGVILAEAASVARAPWIPATNHGALFAIIAIGTAFALWLEQRYRWAEHISAPVLGLLIAMVLSNLGIVPMDTGDANDDGIPDVLSYDFIGTWLLPLALPLMLLQANVIRIARETGRLFLAVHFSTIGTMVGAFVAVALLRHHVPDPEKAGAIMTASYVGGMVNFLGVQDSVLPEKSTVSALVVADNLVMAGFFVLLVWMAGSKFFLRHFAHPHIDSASAGIKEEEDPESLKPMTVSKLAWALGYTACAVAIAMALKVVIGGLFPAELKAGTWPRIAKDLATNRFVLITSVSLVAATFFPRALKPLHGTERIGSYLLYLFLFSIGLAADLKTVIVQSPMFFVFCAIMAIGNLGGTLILGKLFRLPLEALLLASNATLGGPPTAAAMAASRGWPKLVLPGLLAGLWGYIIGTPVGLMVYGILAK